MREGKEFVGEYGDTVLVLRYSWVLDVVYFIDELYYIKDLSVKDFEKKYKPTGRVNKALINLFEEENFINEKK